MAMDRRWAQAPCKREELVLFSRTLDEVVPPDDPVRVLDQCLELVDWTPWEARYASRVGQPPIHPRVVAGCIVFGMMRKIRSSRELEDATRRRVDFMWFTEGRTIDHATFAAFRTDFEGPLRDLNRQISEQVCRRHLNTLLTMVLDGTRVRADSDRHGSRTAGGLDKLIAACVAQLDRKLAALAKSDEGEAAQAQEAADKEVDELRREIARLNKQMEDYQKALEVAQARDAVRRAHNGKGAPPVRVPVTDPDSQISPNKEGGFAPNYTPVVGVDPVSRAIIYQDVLEGSDENAAVLVAVEAVEEMSGKPLEQILADGNFASGPNLEALELRGTTPYMPTGTQHNDGNPANRPDPTVPVPPEDWERLPRYGKYLDGTAFIYDACRDRYYCPMGQPLKPGRHGKTPGGVSYTNYTCAGKAGCPLAGRCVKGKASHRTVRRDQYQYMREHVGRRMSTEEGKAVYAQRAPVVEGVFAEIKHLMGIRRFLLRGLDKVRTEWTWICTAFNLKRLMALLSKAPPQACGPQSALPATHKAHDIASKARLWAQSAPCAA